MLNYIQVCYFFKFLTVQFVIWVIDIQAINIIPNVLPRYDKYKSFATQHFKI